MTRNMQVGKVAKRRPNRFRPDLEPLESRWVPAGNVTAVQAGDLLELDGDALGNQIQLRGGQQPGEVIVQGLAGTTVNGQKRETFEGISRIDAHFFEGDDWVHATNLELVAEEGSAQIQVDLGTGDDRADIINTTLVGTGAGFSPLGPGVGISVAGDQGISPLGVRPSGTAGNDVIRIVGTTMDVIGETDPSQPFSSANAFLTIFGDYGFGILDTETLTGGNDDISVADTTIRVTGAADFHNVSIIIDGDGGSANPGFGASAATATAGDDSIRLTDTSIDVRGGSSHNGAIVAIRGDGMGAFVFGADANVNVQAGDDSIDVSNTTIETRGGQSGLGNFVSVGISGDASFASVFGTSGELTSTVRGGDDDIRVTDTTVSRQAEGTSDTLSFAIRGDGNIVNASSSLFDGAASASASTVGGDDAILVANTTMSLRGVGGGGLFGDLANMQVEGDGDLVSAFGSPETEISQTLTGGDDTILLNKIAISAAVADGTATLRVFGDSSPPLFPGSDPTLLGGNDDVAIHRAEIDAPTSTVKIDAGGGDDDLAVLNSVFDILFAELGDGDDEVLFNHNTFEEATLDGGPGYDTLNAHNNTGLLVPANFQEENVS